jgi:hypothetical protein
MELKMAQGKKQPVEERLYSNIEIDSNDCWVWQGCRLNSGYGTIRNGKKMQLVHRLSYEIEHDCVVPDDVQIGHHCYNYLCVNPKHLYAGLRQTILDNMTENKRWNVAARRTGPHKTYVCPHCNKDIPAPAINRYHNDNCKLKP